MERSNVPISLGSPGEDISTRDISTITQRFKHLHRLRLENLQNFLQPRQRNFIDLLPLIFHENQPLLPGFFSSETPFGIADYTPKKNALLAAQQFSKSYKYTRKARLSSALEGIYLMGSVGSIAYSRNSDLDIWLCHSTSLTPQAIENLQQKSTLIEDWAGSLGLDVHFFMVNSEEFRLGRKTPISEESSGSTQHFLLLEEFYRTAIYLAGKFPVWWIVPPHQEPYYDHYVFHLLENRFVSNDEIIDFGGLIDPPAEEFVSATLWHIFKSLTSPFKSLLKLCLVESYASEYPDIQWTCLKLKSAIYNGDIFLDKLDPYLLIYEKVESYLQSSCSDIQLQLCRQCFFLKLLGTSTNSLDGQSKKHREQVLAQVALRWQWPEYFLQELGKNRFWDINKARQAHHAIRDQLKLSLQNVLRFAGQNADISIRNNDELKLIGRKLHAYFEKKPGKIEILTTRADVINKETELSIIETERGEHLPLWRLHKGPINHGDTPENTIKECETLLELLAWMIINGLYRNNVRVNWSASDNSVTRTDLMLLIQQLDVFLSTHYEAKLPLDNYRAPNRVASSLLVINFGKIIDDENKDGNLVMSERSDPLSYGESRTSFIATVERITITSWGEILTQHYYDLEGLFDCLCYIFNNSQPPLTEKNLSVSCVTPYRANSIILRIEKIFSRLLQYFSESTIGRYILPGRNSYYLFKKTGDNVEYIQLETDDMLMHELASTQPQFSPVYFDEFVLNQTLIPHLYKSITPGFVNFFYIKEDDEVTVYIIDEKAALFVQRHPNCNIDNVLSNYYVFFNALFSQASLAFDLEIEYYEIKKNSSGTISYHPIEIHKYEPFKQLNIRITSELDVDRSNHLIIFCNDKKFSSKEHNNIFANVRNYILQFRNNKNTYPVYINEIEVSAKFLGVDNLNQAHTVHYLQYKQKIEKRLMML